MHSLRASNLGTSLLLAAGAIATTAAVVFAAGAVVLPAQEPDPGQQAAATSLTIGDLAGSQALVVLRGDDEGRYELNQLTVGDWNEGTSAGEPLTLSLTFRGNDVYLQISASDITTENPARGNAASATIGIDGASYFGNNGECTVTVETVDYEVLEPQPAVLDGVPRGVPIPTYAGTVECIGIQELRTERRIDLHAVFRHDPQD